MTSDFTADSLPETTFQTSSIWFGISDKHIVWESGLKMWGAKIIKNLVKTVDSSPHTNVSTHTTCSLFKGIGDPPDTKAQELWALDNNLCCRSWWQVISYNFFSLELKEHFSNLQANLAWFFKRKIWLFFFLKDRDTEAKRISVDNYLDVIQGWETWSSIFSSWCYCSLPVYHLVCKNIKGVVEWVKHVCSGKAIRCTKA